MKTLIFLGVMMIGCGGSTGSDNGSDLIPGRALGFETPSMRDEPGRAYLFEFEPVKPPAIVCDAPEPIVGEVVWPVLADCAELPTITIDAGHMRASCKDKDTGELHRQNISRAYPGGLSQYSAGWCLWMLTITPVE